MIRVFQALRFVCVLWLVSVPTKAQPGCPAVRFDGALSASLKPTDSSHVILVRQGDGSYTGYEIADASPISILRTTPKFQTQLTACAFGSDSFVPAPYLTARLPAGGYLLVRIVPSSTSATMEADVFDPGFNLIAQRQYTPIPLLALADVNGDGIPDIIGGRTSRNSASVEISLGTGGAGFGPAVDSVVLNTQGNIQAVAVADVNGDGKPDLAVATTGNLSGSSGISLLIGNGDGTFQAAKAVLVIGRPQAVALADLNGDGKPDLVATVPDNIGFPTAAVALGNGDGTFGPLTQYPAGGSGAIAVGDVDGDGIPDIVTSGITILYGDGKGNFPRRRDYLDDAAEPILLADFDGDGITDIVMGGRDPSIITGDRISVLLGRGKGKFAGAPVSLVPGLADANNLGLTSAVADFNADGIPDLVFSDLRGITILKGAGDGTFAPVFRYDTSGFASALVVADLNHDGKPDLAATIDRGPSNPGVVQVFHGMGDGTFQPPVTFTAGLGAWSLAVGDFNRDGIVDLAVVISTESFGAEDRVVMFLGTAAGTYVSAASYAVGPHAHSVVATDFNNDGKSDLAVASDGTYSKLDGSLTILVGKGDGTFAAPVAIPLSGGPSVGPYSLVAADLNRDGKMDLAVTLSNDPTYPGGLAVLIGRGDGTFQQPVVYAVTSAGVTVGDLNGDKIPDLIVGTPRSTDAYAGAGYLLGQGDGTFQPEVGFAGEVGPLAAADFNGDGKMDLAGPTGLYGMAAFLNVSAAQIRAPLTLVSAASFVEGPVAADAIVSAFGSQLAGTTAQAGAGTLPTTLGGTTVMVADASGVSRAAPLYYVSPTQINFVVPAGTSVGLATVTIGGGPSAFTSQIQIARTAPSLFTLNPTNLAAAYVTRVSATGVITVEPVFATHDGLILPAPIVAGPNVYLTLFGTGLRNAGEGAVRVAINPQLLQVQYAGPQPEYPGLDQVNVLLPAQLSSGVVEIALTAGTAQANTVTIQIK